MGTNHYIVIQNHFLLKISFSLTFSLEFLKKICSLSFLTDTPQRVKKCFDLDAHGGVLITFLFFDVSFKSGSLRVHLEINLLFRNCKKMWWVVPEKETCFMKTDAHHFHQSLPQICLSIFFEKPDSVSVS